MPLTLGLSQWFVGISVVVFMAISVVLILVVLIQRPQGGGLSGAFGSSAGSGQTAFGAKTGDVLTFATIGMFVLWLLVAVGLVFATRPSAITPPTAPQAGGVDSGAVVSEEPAPGEGGASETGESAQPIELDPETMQPLAPEGESTDDDSENSSSVDTPDEPITEDAGG
ncbi:MAG: preprotein translocase subunit SecG [Planctomycetota bacterium]